MQQHVPVGDPVLVFLCYQQVAEPSTTRLTNPFQPLRYQRRSRVHQPRKALTGRERVKVYALPRGPASRQRQYPNPLLIADEQGHEP